MTLNPLFLHDQEASFATAAMGRYASGEEVSFTRLHDVVAPHLYRFLARQTRDPAAVQDLVQTTLLRIHACRSQFRPGSPFFPWAFTIARRVLIDSFRRSRRRRGELELGPATEPGTGPRVEDHMDALFAFAEMRRLLANLPENQRVAFELIEVEGRSLGEAAELLGVTKMAVRVRAHRARVALRAGIVRVDSSWLEGKSLTDPEDLGGARLVAPRGRQSRLDAAPLELVFRRAKWLGCLGSRRGRRGGCWGRRRRRGRCRRRW
jgi:RNA polymerase sigma factor (sigma-70 family)